MDFVLDCLCRVCSIRFVSNVMGGEKGLEDEEG